MSQTFKKNQNILLKETLCPILIRQNPYKSKSFESFSLLKGENLNVDKCSENVISIKTDDGIEIEITRFDTRHTPVYLVCSVKFPKKFENIIQELKKAPYMNYRNFLVEYPLLNSQKENLPYIEFIRNNTIFWNTMNESSEKDTFVGPEQLMIEARALIVILRAII
jgi:hypothetical protein